MACGASKALCTSGLTLRGDTATSSPEPLNPSHLHMPNRVNLLENCQLSYCLGGHTCTFAGVWPLHLAAKAGIPRARGAKPSDASPCGHAIMIIAIAGDAPACHACAFPCACHHDHDSCMSHMHAHACAPRICDVNVTVPGHVISSTRSRPCKPNLPENRQRTFLCNNGILYALAHLSIIVPSL
jgi:hypothetical protein